MSGTRFLGAGMLILKRAAWWVQVEQDLVCSAGTTANLQSAYEQV